MRVHTGDVAYSRHAVVCAAVAQSAGPHLACAEEAVGWEHTHIAVQRAHQQHLKKQGRRQGGKAIDRGSSLSRRKSE